MELAVLLCLVYFRFIWIFKQFSAYLAVIKLLLLFTSFPYLFNFIVNILMWMLRILWKRKTGVGSDQLAAGTKDPISWLRDQFSNSCLIDSWALLVIDMNFIFDIFFKPHVLPGLHTRLACMFAQACVHTYGFPLPLTLHSTLKKCISLPCPQAVFTSRTKWEMKAVESKGVILTYGKKYLSSFPGSFAWVAKTMAPFLLHFDSIDGLWAIWA